MRAWEIPVIVLVAVILVASSVLPSAYATANISDWTVTLTNVNNGKSFSWNSVDTEIGDCLSGSFECIIPLTEGKLRKCINENVSSGKFIVWNPYLDGQLPPVPRNCNGPWELTITGTFVCEGLGQCTVKLGPF